MALIVQQNGIGKPDTIVASMLIVITILILLFTALALIILRFARPEFRFSWLIAVGGVFLAWISVFIWRVQMPLELKLPAWQPAFIFSQSPTFIADGIAWAFALSLVTLCLAVIITAIARPNFPNPLNWANTIALSSLGLLAVTADNPLTLLLIWAAIDLTDLVIQLRYVEGTELNERVVIAFSTRVGGVLLLLWADVVSASTNQPMDFVSAPAQVGLYLVLAAGLRLGVLPLHLPYPNESSLRRGLGTGLRLISAASSLVLLARIPSSSLVSSLTIPLVLFTTIAALYGGWMWLRSPDELTGRPFLMIGLAALAVAAALRANPIGAAAWGCALILIGGALFLSSAQNVWLNRALMIGVVAMSSLPFTLTASGWEGTYRTWIFPPFLIASHAMLMAGYFRHALRPAKRDDFEDQPIWARNVYPIGIGLMLFTTVVLGLMGWDGGMRLGNWLASAVASVLTVGLIWLSPRVRALNPVRAHWVRPAPDSWLTRGYGAIWSLYRRVGQLSDSITNVLEGEGGIMWTMVFLVLFFSLLQGNP